MDETMAQGAKLICPRCGAISKPKTPLRGILQAVGLVAMIPLIVAVVVLLVGQEAAHDNSMIMTFGALAFLGMAWQALKAGFTHSTECLSCGNGTQLVVLDSDAGRKVVADREAARQALKNKNQGDSGID